MFANGHYYKMYTVDAHGQELGILDLESQIEWIKKDSEQMKGIFHSFLATVKLD